MVPEPDREKGSLPATYKWQMEEGGLFEANKVRPVW